MHYHTLLPKYTLKVKTYLLSWNKCYFILCLLPQMFDNIGFVIKRWSLKVNLLMKVSGMLRLGNFFKTYLLFRGEGSVS